MKEYRHANWIKFREDVIKLHCGCCARCGRSRSDTILQVHHKYYIKDRLAWEYDVLDCEALCKGCHAAEHGIIMPRVDWVGIGVDDLGDLNGNCELCGTDIRYVYAIQHPSWGSLAVGTVCCDKLTGTLAASEHMERHQKLVDAQKRFVNSKRWKACATDGLIMKHNGFIMKHKGIIVGILENDGAFSISINHIQGRKRFESLIAAKIKLFQLLKSGEIREFLARRRLRELDVPTCNL